MNENKFFKFKPGVNTIRILPPKGYRFKHSAQPSKFGWYFQCLCPNYYPFCRAAIELEFYKNGRDVAGAFNEGSD